MNNNWTNKDDLHLEKTMQHISRSRNEITKNIDQSTLEIIKALNETQKDLIDTNSKLDRILVIVWTVLFVAVFYGIMYLIIS